MPKKDHNQQLKILDQKVNELEDKWKRALADYRNLEKRVDREKGQFVKIANADLISKLLVILDNLERATKHVKDSGLNMIITDFKQLLTTEGVEEITAQDQKFDPETMECIETIAGKKDYVLTVIEKGYRLGDTLLRPAKVEVGLGKNNKA